MKVASRYLLPLEMFYGLYMLGWGLSGIGLFKQGGLYFALVAADHVDAWGFVLCPLGLAMFLVAWIEWRWGRSKMCLPPVWAPCEIPWLRWTNFFRYRWWMAISYLKGWDQDLRQLLSTQRATLRFVSIRSVLAFLSMGAWIGGGMIVLTADALEQIVILGMAAPLHVAWGWWMYHENLRVRYALSSQYQTRALELAR